MEQAMGVIARGMLIVAAAIAGAWAMFAWAWVPHRNSIEITELTRRTNAAGETKDEYSRTVRARENVRALASLRASAPADVRVPALIAENYEFLGQYDEMLRASEDALRVEPRPELYVLHGDALLALGRVDDAVESYAVAARFDPIYLEKIMETGLLDRVRERAAAKNRG
jgi:tetratricopeptide (TPR) repeat protein